MYVQSVCICICICEQTHTHTWCTYIHIHEYIQIMLICTRVDDIPSKYKLAVSHSHIHRKSTLCIHPGITHMFMHTSNRALHRLSHLTSRCLSAEWERRTPAYPSISAAWLSSSAHDVFCVWFVFRLRWRTCSNQRIPAPRVVGARFCGDSCMHASLYVNLSTYICPLTHTSMHPSIHRYLVMPKRSYVACIHTCKHTYTTQICISRTYHVNQLVTRQQLRLAWPRCFECRTLFVSAEIPAPQKCWSNQHGFPVSRGYISAVDWTALHAHAFVRVCVRACNTYAYIYIKHHALNWNKNIFRMHCSSWSKNKHLGRPVCAFLS